MKKHYYKPTTRVVKLRRYRILSGSPWVKSCTGTPYEIFWASEGIGDTEVLR
jgi:hypothetical protein